MTTSSTDPTRMTKRTCGVLTWRMYIYREVVFTKVVPNHLDSQYESSKWSSRLPYPPQIQSKGQEDRWSLDLENVHLQGSLGSFCKFGGRGRVAGNSGWAAGTDSGWMMTIFVMCVL